MAAEATPLALRCADLLDDGEWHDYEKFLREAGKIIPPGRAMRNNEANRKRLLGVRGVNDPSTDRKVPRPTERQIEAGKRAIIAGVVKDSRHYETRPFGKIPTGSDVRREIRMLSVPPAVEQWRRDHREIDGERIADELRTAAAQGVEALSILLDRLSHSELEHAAIAMLDVKGEGREPPDERSVTPE